MKRVHPVKEKLILSHRLISMFIVALMSVLTCSYSFALGLGGATLKSSYNEPLVAEFKILQAQNLSKGEVLVSLASKNDFERAGIDRDFFLTSLRFEVIFETPSNTYLRVTTRQPVQEPYLNFLVDLKWPSGRLLREYTLFLDIPLYADNVTDVEPVLPALTPETSFDTLSATPLVNNKPSIAQSNPLPADSASLTKSLSVNGVTVTPGDTLWELARKMRPNSSLNVLQTMVAIQNANPDAFIDGNINLLRTGATLRALTVSEIEATNYQKSAVSVKQQTDNWQQKEGQVSVGSGLPLTNPDFVDTVQEESAELGSNSIVSAGFDQEESFAENELNENLQSDKLVAIKERLANTQQELGKLSREGSVDSKASPSLGVVSENQPVGRLTLDRPISNSSYLDQDAENVALQNELDIAKEKLAKSSQENDELKNRLLELQDVVISTTNRLELLESEVLALQGQYVYGLPLTSNNGEMASANSVALTDEGTPLVSGELGGGTINGRAPLGSEKEEATIVTNSIFYLMIAIFTVFLIVLLLLFRSREVSKNYDEPTTYLAPSKVGSEHEVDVLPTSILTRRGGETENAEPLILQPEKENSSRLEVNAAPKTETETETETETRAVNILDEVNIYIELGQVDEAKKILQREVQLNPTNAEARVALFELYVKLNNTDALDDEYTQSLYLNASQVNNEDTQASSYEPKVIDDITVDADDINNEAVIAATESLNTEKLPLADVNELLDQDLDLYFVGDDNPEEVVADSDEGLEVEEGEFLNNLQNGFDAVIQQQPESDGSAQNGSFESIKEPFLESELVEDETADFDFDSPPENIDMVLLDLELDEMSAAMLECESVSAELGNHSVTENNTEKNFVGALASIVKYKSQVDNINTSHIANEKYAKKVALTDNLNFDDEDFHTSENEVETKLDLAQAYLDTRDFESAEDILNEVVEEGDDEQKMSAKKLLKIGSSS